MNDWSPIDKHISCLVNATLVTVQLNVNELFLAIAKKVGYGEIWTLDVLGKHLDRVDDSEKLKEKLQLILNVKDAVSFKDFFGKLKNTTEKDIALALIYQATVEQI